MKDKLQSSIRQAQRGFADFTPGQKATAVIGTVALLLAGFMVFRWVSQPTYAPLFSNLSGSDASAVVEQLESAGTPYKIANGGSTIMVPKEQVYKTRITLSGAGVPSGSDSGYKLLDEQSLSTSQFQEQTSFKRAMEGELSKTIEAIDGVNTAVVHLALPQKQVFADAQAPATASVLLGTAPGTTMTPAQVQSIVHLVASSIDNLDPAKVTVADQSGNLLSGSDAQGSGGASTRNQAVEEIQNQMDADIQSILDRVVGPGNGTAQVTAALNFDKTQTKSTRYEQPEGDLELSSTRSSETYNGPGAGNGVGGVVGPDGQMDEITRANGGSGDSQYRKRDSTSDNALNSVVEVSDRAPGSVESLHVGILLDTTAAAAVDTRELESMIAAAVGYNADRGDTLRVSVLPFNRAAEEEAAAAIKAAEAADKAAATNKLYRNVALAVLLLLVLLGFWIRARRKAKARKAATNYVVEQLVASRPEPVQVEPAPALPALEPIARTEEDEMREELVELVESQPEEVAALLRGWLVDRR